MRYFGKGEGEGAGDIGSRRMKWRVSRSSTCPGGPAAESSRNPPPSTPFLAGSLSSASCLRPRRLFSITSNSFDARDFSYSDSAPPPPPPRNGSIDPWSNIFPIPFNKSGRTGRAELSLLVAGGFARGRQPTPDFNARKK